MKTWEVIIPPAGGGSLQTLIIQGATSMMALSEGLRQLSDPADLSSLMCKILPHGALEVVDHRSGRTITIREVDPTTFADNAAAAASAAPPATVPPPDPSTGEPAANTNVGMPVLGQQEAAEPPGETAGQAPAPADKPKRNRRQTQELISTASGMSTSLPTPQTGVAAPPVAAPPPAGPPPARPPTGPSPPPTAEVPAVDPLRSSGEVEGSKEVYQKRITEPAIIIDDYLQAEIEQLETVRKAREEAMTPPTMRPIPHKVFKVLAEAPEAPRFETVRRRYVSVWPNPPADALSEVLQIQLAQVRAELETVGGARRVLIAAFDHAFEKIPLRPPLGLCTWSTSGDDEPDAAFVFGDQAAALWGPARPSTGTTKSPLMVPALDPAQAALGRPAGADAADVKTAVVPTVDSEGRPVRETDVLPPLPAPTPPAASPPPASPAPPPTAPPTAAGAPTAAGIASPPAPVEYPSELQGQVYDDRRPAPTPAPPTGTLDPFYPPAHGSGPAQVAAPPASAPQELAPPETTTEPSDLLSRAFERFQPLFYVTDRQQAFAFAVDTALGLVPSQAGVLLLYDYEARDLYSAVIRAPGGARIAGYRTAVGEGVAGFCATQGLPLALAQGDDDARFSTVLGAQCGIQVYTLAGVPIQYEGRLYGVMELANRQAGGAYTTEELNALAYIGRQLAERLSTTLSGQLPIGP